MKLDILVKKVTGKPLGTYIDNGHYCITRAQAIKLCGGRLPRQGYEMTMQIVDDKPAPSTSSSTHKYIVTETYVFGRTDIRTGMHWSVRHY